MIPVHPATDAALEVLDRMEEIFPAVDSFDILEAQAAVLCEAARFDVAAEMYRRIFAATDPEIFDALTDVCRKAGLDETAMFWMLWGVPALMGE